MSRLTRLTLLAAAIATFAFAAAAGAGPPIGELPPLPPEPKPNLVVTEASAAPAGTAQWELRTTVKNAGNAPAPAFHVDTHRDGSALIKSTAHASLAAGASRSETIMLPRTSCYLAVRFLADSKNAVAESTEVGNTRWAVAHTSATCSSLPRYAIKAVSFRAVDETGIDWLGSDEPFWTFNAVGTEGTARSTASRVFGSVDTGHTASFDSTEGCIYLSCAGGAAPDGIGVSLQLWEKDLGYVNGTLSAVATAFRSIGRVYPLNEAEWIVEATDKLGSVFDEINSWAADDLVGWQLYTYMPVDLAQRLPAVGASFDDTRTYSGGGGRYTMTTRVTRVG
jgi:hypothetical protein